MELYLVFLLLVSLLFALLIQQAAKLRGRSPRLWFVLGICFGLLALVALYLLPQKSIKEEKVIPVAVNNQAMPEEPKENDPSFIETPKNNDASYWYFINQDKKTIGPMSFEHLCQEYFEGKLQQRTYIWADHMTDWERLESMSRLSAELADYRPSPPPAQEDPEQPMNG
ncbi:MAG: hypothetical protein K940chlam8_01092 [Chlamydiae bacterium]|nr:hypothetical protein [Chlamydiota bacterium]